MELFCRFPINHHPLSIREFYKLGRPWMVICHFRSWGTIYWNTYYIHLTFLVQMEYHRTRDILFGFSLQLQLFFFIKLYKKSDVKPFTNIAYTFLRNIYMLLFHFHLLHVIAFCTGMYQFELVTGILLLTWASDTGGYFAGTFFGKTKLVSCAFHQKNPGKGFVGGAYTYAGS